MIRSVRQIDREIARLWRERGEYLAHGELVLARVRARRVDRLLDERNQAIGGGA